MHPFRALFCFSLFLAFCAAPLVPARSAKPESLAECLARKGAHVYGASWCGHCRDQRELFGDEAAKVPYTDCQPEGTFSNIPECVALDIAAFPTWIFRDGTRILGVRSPAWLARRTGCPAP